MEMILSFFLSIQGRRRLEGAQGLLTSPPHLFGMKQKRPIPWRGTLCSAGISIDFEPFAIAAKNCKRVASSVR